MIPVFNNFLTKTPVPIYQTTDNQIGFGLRLDSIDIESSDQAQTYKNLKEFITNLHPKLLVKIKTISKHLKKSAQTELGAETLRPGFLSTFGHNVTEVFLFVEVPAEPVIVQELRSLFSKTQNTENLDLLRSAYNLITTTGISFRPIDETTIINQFFVDPKQITRKKSGFLNTGENLIGIIRLIRQSNSEISEEEMAKILKDLPRPYEYFISFRKSSEAKTKLNLERKLRQSDGGGNDPTLKLISDSTRDTISDLVISNISIIETEILILLSIKSENELFEDLNSSKSILSALGEFRTETFGTGVSFTASLIGNNQHITFLEKSDVLPLFLPIWVTGETNARANLSGRSLVAHRKDESLHHFDLFYKNFNVFNTLILGTSGKGKSLLTGLLTKSLLNDPNIEIIKLDVGGSHSKECRLLGGCEKTLELGKPSGINPFLICKNEKLSESEKIGIQTRFLSTLIKEQGENFFSKEIRGQIENSIKSYLPKANRFDIDEFFELAVDFPRRNLLRRWTSAGVYASAFADPLSRAFGSGAVEFQAAGLPHPSLRYYNFSKIFQASDPEFAEAGVAAVLSDFNERTLSENNKRIVLICDETPFFIKSCFDFFKFTTANVRKFGHAVILISQLSDDLIVNGDLGIIENSPQSYRLNPDIPEKMFLELLSLSTNQMCAIEGLSTIPNKFSECFLQTGTTGRVLKIRVTPLEYWALTSSSQENQKLQKVMNAVPELSLSEAIKCLSVS